MFDDLKIESREEFYDEKLWYDPDRRRHPASGSGRLPTKHVPFYEVVDVGGKNKWKVVNPYTGEIKYYPYGEHDAAKAYYNGLYDDYLKSKGAPSAPIPKNETVKQKHEKESNYLTRDQVDDMPYRKLNKSRLDPTIDYLPNETDAEIQHVITVKDKPSQHGVVYHDKYIMLAEHSAKKREIKPIPSKH